MEPYQRLEQEWAAFNGVDSAGMVACASGTAALHLALEAFQLPLGSKVVTGDFNMVAVPRAIMLAGLTPVFVDCDKRLLMNCLKVPFADEEAKAVIVTHIYGRQLNFITACKKGAGPFWCWRDESSRCIVEDLAEAHGIKPQPCAAAACWSFYRNKIVAGEEGGAVWFRDPAHANLARQLRSLGFTDKHDFTHIPRGHNYRMSNAHARPILASLANYGKNLAARRAVEKLMDDLCPAEWRMPPRDAPWVYDMRIPGLTANAQDRIVEALQDAGVAARHAFKPMSAQAEFGGSVGPEAEKASREVIYLPLTPNVMRRARVRLAFDTIKKITQRLGA